MDPMEASKLAAEAAWKVRKKELEISLVGMVVCELLRCDTYESEGIKEIGRDAGVIVKYALKTLEEP